MDGGVLKGLAELRPPAQAAAQLGLPAGALRLRRAWPRDGGHLLLEYEAAGGLSVPGQWLLERQAAAHVLAKTAGQACALFELPEAPGSVVLQLRGADRRLPGLAPQLAMPGALLLVHQPERRAVVRLPAQAGAVFAKVVRPERARGLAESGEAAAALGGGAFETPRLVALEEGAGVVVWSGLEGAPLHQLRGAGAEDGAAAAGRALRAFHDAAPPPAAPIHGPAAERATLERWMGLAAAFDPRLGAQVAALAPAVWHALARAAGPYTTIHRDFYDKQVLIGAGGRVGLLDFDTLARGEPALDLANALVHIELRGMQGLLEPGTVARARAALIAGYGPGPEVRARLGAYSAAALLRLACVYAFRPRWRRCAGALLARAREQGPG